MGKPTKMPNFDIEQQAKNMLAMVQVELTRPSVLFRPTVAQDGDQWCALYGENIMEGVCAFGPTPDLACRQFDIEWVHQKAVIPPKPPPTPAEPPRPPMEPN